MNYEAKHDEGKLQLSLVPTQIIRDIAEVRMYGNKKYGDPDNWKTVEIERYVDALLRHTLAFLDDPDSLDEESGIPHYKHMACNMAFICDMKALRVKMPEEPYTTEDFVIQEADRLGVLIIVSEGEDGSVVRLTQKSTPLKDGRTVTTHIPYGMSKEERLKRIYTTLMDNFGGTEWDT